mmetsp:Transcript_143824/g.203463  ORF Transcript_143824/g.203463 Transcript_143824/m.203463 type:complete len:155 (+) Transcript_143824:116-580(+)
MSSDDIKIEEYDSDHAIVNFKTSGGNSFKGSNFLNKGTKKGNAKTNTNNLPVLSNQNMNYQKSTLFCPSGYHIVDEEEKTGGFEDENNAKDNFSNTQYLQLIVPKSSLSKFNLMNMNQDLVPADQNEESNNAGNNKMVELWCKVFYQRELSADY